MAELLVVAVCLVLNAFISCFEMAFVTVSKPHLKSMTKKGSSPAKVLLALRENPERTLSVLQIGITMVGMISAAVGGAGAEESLSPFFEIQLGFSEGLAEIAAISCVVLPLTYFSVVFGELVPKAIALRNPLAIALLGASWSQLAEKLLSPFVALLEISTKLTLNVLGMGAKKEEPAGTQVELESLTQFSQQYVHNIVHAESKKIRDFMLPWAQVQSVHESDSPEAVLSIVLGSGHTRLPVLRDNDVVGLLHSKEFMAYSASAAEPWFSIVRPVVVFGEDELALRALRTLQSQRSHLAVILAADKRPLGIVTIEDILEEIIGDVYDEDDDGRIKRLFSGHTRLKGILGKE
jgi:putative hemolysin